MNYKEWEAAVPEMIVGDTLWRVQAYRLALFASDIGWGDVGRLAQEGHATFRCQASRPMPGCA